MEIKLKLFHNLRKMVFPEDERFVYDFALADKSKIADLIAQLDIPNDLSILVFVNGSACTTQHELQPGDLVSLMLPAGGG